MQGLISYLLWEMLFSLSLITLALLSARDGCLRLGRNSARVHVVLSVSTVHPQVDGPKTCVDACCLVTEKFTKNSPTSPCLAPAFHHELPRAPLNIQIILHSRRREPIVKTQRSESKNTRRRTYKAPWSVYLWILDRYLLRSITLQTRPYILSLCFQASTTSLMAR
jgi:hypothetical protein